MLVWPLRDTEEEMYFGPIQVVAVCVFAVISYVWGEVQVRLRPRIMNLGLYCAYVCVEIERVTVYPTWSCLKSHKALTMTGLLLFSSGLRGFSLTMDLDLLTRLWTCLLFSMMRSFAFCKRTTNTSVLYWKSDVCFGI